MPPRLGAPPSCSPRVPPTKRSRRLRNSPSHGRHARPPQPLEPLHQQLHDADGEVALARPRGPLQQTHRRGQGGVQGAHLRRVEGRGRRQRGGRHPPPPRQHVDGRQRRVPPPGLIHQHVQVERPRRRRRVEEVGRRRRRRAPAGGGRKDGREGEVGLEARERAQDGRRRKVGGGRRVEEEELGRSPPPSPGGGASVDNHSPRPRPAGATAIDGRVHGAPAPAGRCNPGSTSRLTMTPKAPAGRPCASRRRAPRASDAEPPRRSVQKRVAAAGPPAAPGSWRKDTATCTPRRRSTSTAPMAASR
eukprot:TRINITY_DN14828_c0_g1_i1.p2 TRINITY_DN14828_c0_g1~~TRINITY_DN14828_c0_g1_i1.p2  ORF type:complete len:304 (+),score=36.64 TRINITY_DN14828_c0_g1_i1:48-959(+)